MTHRSRIELWTAQQAAAADRHTIEELGVPSPVLMERASLCVSHEIVTLLGQQELPVVVLVGPGNNGGDGLAVARQLAGWGSECHVVLATSRRNEACQAQLELARAVGVGISSFPPTVMPSRAVVVDGLLGTGSQGEPRGSVGEALDWQEEIAGPRVAIDIPSGVDVDTGRAGAPCFWADVTVTFVRSKPGLHITPGRRRAGRIVVADIGIVAAPITDPQVRTSLRLADPEAVAGLIAGLAPGRHKGERGHVGIVGGSPDTPGAAVLAATAALRAGAGFVTVLTRGDAVREQLIAHRPELMVATAHDGAAVLPRASTLVVGPGLTDPLDHTRLPELYLDDPRPALWDASALDHVPFDAEPKGARIVTPHPAEAARMLRRAEVPGSWNASSVQSQRLHVARALAARTGAVVVLKGEGSVVAEPEGRVEVAIAGTSALATAGSGDCLAGLGGALLGRGLRDPFVAAGAAVHIHGGAGQLAAARYPFPTALEIADAIGPVMVGDRVPDPPDPPRLRLG